MRYSQVLTSFYRIALLQVDKDLLDTHFTASAHHYIRYHEAIDPVFEIFHRSLFHAHLRELLRIVYTRGSFSCAEDQSFRNLDDRESWDPDCCQMPDPEMFDDMSPDPRFEVGSNHSSDRFLGKAAEMQLASYSERSH